MAAIVVELPAPRFKYVPAFVADDKYFEFSVYRDESRNNCMRVVRYVGEVSPPFSSAPAVH